MNYLYIQQVGWILMIPYVEKDQFQKVMFCVIAENSGSDNYRGQRSKTLAAKG